MNYFENKCTTERTSMDEQSLEETYVDAFFRNVHVLEDVLCNEYNYCDDDDDATFTSASTAEESTTKSIESNSSNLSPDIALLDTKILFKDHEAPSERPLSLDKLAECMERSALSRSLVEHFCQDFLRDSRSRPRPQHKRPISKQRAHRRPQSIDNKKKRKHNRQTRIGFKIRAISSESAIGSFLRQRKPTNSLMLSKRKNEDFRASGLKLASKTR